MLKYFKITIIIIMEHKFSGISVINFIKVLSAYRGISLRKLLARLSANKGYGTCYPSFYTKLKNSTIRFSEVNDIADELGYEIIFRDVT